MERNIFAVFSSKSTHERIRAAAELYSNNGRHLDRPLPYAILIREGGHTGTASTISPIHHYLPRSFRFPNGPAPV